MFFQMLKEYEIENWEVEERYGHEAVRWYIE